MSDAEPDLKRLFLGIPLAHGLRRRLTPLRPPADMKVKPVSPSQMHVTLHFIGQAHVAPIAASLAELEYPAFSIPFAELGHFGSSRRGGVLWAGLGCTADLVELHRGLGEKLQELGHRTDSRHFRSHVTLARCRPGTAPRVFEDFLKQDMSSMPDLPAANIVLFSSTQAEGGSVYRAEYVRRLHVR